MRSTPLGRLTLGALMAAAATAALMAPTAYAAQAQSAAEVSLRAGRSFLPTDGYQRRSAVDVLHYDIAVSVPARGRRIGGEVGVLFEVVDRELRVLPLDFGKLTIDSVKVEEARATFRHLGERLTIDLPPFKRGARARAVIWYHGEPVDGLFLKENRHGKTSVFADNWPNRAHHWFPGVDHPSDKATVDFEIEAPAAMEVIAPGVLRQVVEVGEGRERTRWSMSSEIQTYCMVFGATDFAIHRAGVVGGVEISHWTFPEDSLAAVAGFSRTVEAAAFFDSLFGPFPYDKLAHVQSSTRFGGMENASAIFYDEKQFGPAPERADGGERQRNGEGNPAAAEPVREGAFTEVVAHETVHQWFGDAVTESDWHHLWLSEGFATYFEAVFFEFHGGPEGSGPAELARRMRVAADAVIAHFAKKPKPVIDTAEYDYFELLNPNNYQKGAWILHMLRRQVGGEAFFRGVRDYYVAFRDGTAWTADFQRVMERASRRELGWFFDQWLRRPGHPVIAVSHDELEEESGLSVVTVRQIQPGPPFSFPLDLEIRWRGGARRERVTVVDKEESFRFDTPSPIENVILDPDGWLLHEAAR